jgi:hypothetical protein
MVRVGRFLWLPWAEGEVRSPTCIENGDVRWWEGRHKGYCRLAAPVTHTRAVVLLPDETWVVIDALESKQAHEYRLHWLLGDYAFLWQPADGTLELSVAHTKYRIAVLASRPDILLELVRAAEGSTRGWQASTYHNLIPALSLSAATKAPTVRFVTVFGPSWHRITLHAKSVCVQLAHHKYVVELMPEWGSAATIRAVHQVSSSEQPLENREV